MLTNQFEMAETNDRQAVTSILLNDGFVLGYVFGFADEASRHFNGRHHSRVGSDYIRQIFANVAQNDQRSETFVMFARLQLGDVVFRKGYGKAIRDLDLWWRSLGHSLPVSLADHLGNTGAK